MRDAEIERCWQMIDIFDLGHNHSWRFTTWKPDRALNPQYAHLPDLVPCGGIIDHLTPTGEPCRGAVTFDTPTARAVFTNETHFWRLVTRDPLTLEPSIVCQRCGDHGFIRGGKWIPA